MPISQRSRLRLGGDGSQVQQLEQEGLERLSPSSQPALPRLRGPGWVTFANRGCSWGHRPPRPGVHLWSRLPSRGRQAPPAQGNKEGPLHPQGCSDPLHSTAGAPLPCL